MVLSFSRGHKMETLFFSIGDMVRHRYVHDEKQAKIIGIVVDISKAAWDEQFLLYHVEWLNSPHPVRPRFDSSRYRCDHLEKV